MGVVVELHNGPMPFNGKKVLLKRERERDRDRERNVSSSATFGKGFVCEAHTVFHLYPRPSPPISCCTPCLVLTEQGHFFVRILTKIAI